MSYVTCPNCGVTLESAWGAGPPSTCPDCCARLHQDVALDSATAARRGSSSSLDAVLLSGRDAPSMARQQFESFAAQLGDDVVSAGSLLVSEIVTNAVLHGPAAQSSTIELHCAITGPRLQVEVSDDGRGFVPPLPYEGADATDGWGLQLVDGIAADWGVEAAAPTRVWFELAL